MIPISYYYAWCYGENGQIKHQLYVKILYKYLEIECTGLVRNLALTYACIVQLGHKWQCKFLLFGNVDPIHCLFSASSCLMIHLYLYTQNLEHMISHILIFTMFMVFILDIDAASNSELKSQK
jgi:hypothetical protein